MVQLSLFQTDLGWFGLLGSGSRVDFLTIGHSSRDQARGTVKKAALRRDAPLADWWPELRERLERYARGEPQAFADVDVSLAAVTAFRRRVLTAARKIEWGRTCTYGELAEQVGRPRAARAIGGAMAANPCPLIVPCHRVVGASGKLVGFSAPQGVRLKERLLEMEGGLRAES